MKDGVQSLDRALALLEAIVADDGRTAAAYIASQLRLAPSSARRMIGELERRGLLTRVAHGRYAGGEKLLMLSGMINPHRRLVEVARPILRRLAQREGWTAHLGVYRGEMVTYLVKEGGSDIFTREGAQLEAYCTGIGKALLAQLPEGRLETYLRGPFVRLTAQTICDPEMLRNEVALTRRRGFALDDREMSDSIACVAIPLMSCGNALAAISLSGDAAAFPLNRATIIARRLGHARNVIASRIEAMEMRDRALASAQV